jgi:DNA repair protein RadC
MRFIEGMRPSPMRRNPKDGSDLRLLDNRRVIAFEKLFLGTIDGTSVHAREVVEAALKCNAAAVIFARSGVAEPSRADEALTRQLKDALALVGIRVLDHIIVAGTDTVSLAERGLL